MGRERERKGKRESERESGTWRDRDRNRDSERHREIVRGIRQKVRQTDRQHVAFQVSIYPQKIGVYMQQATSESFFSLLCLVVLSFLGEREPMHRRGGCSLSPSLSLY